MDIGTIKQRLPNYRKHLLYLFVLWVCWLVIEILLVSGTARIGFEGIRVDRNGNIYVGVPGEIRVFDPDGQLLRTISPKTSKSYVFELDKDKLLVDCYSTTYVMDLNGSVLETIPRSTLPSVMKTPDTVTVNKAIYHIRSGLFYRVTIEKQGVETVAVRQPALDWGVTIAFFVAWIAGFVLILTVLRKLRKPA